MSLTDVLSYLRELGWEDVYPAPAPPAPPAPAGQAGQSLPDAGDRVAVAGQQRADLEALAVECATCERCRLAAGRRSVVFGTGNPAADLMFIGEGPGAEEDRQGVPFVGAAGELLDRIIKAIDLRREDVYIANVVKCRPPANRDPEPDEIAACRVYLERQIALVQPRVIVALGRVAAQTLLGCADPVGRMRGHWHEVFGVPMRVTYHPAALLRSSTYRRPTWEDMQLVRDHLRGL